MRASIRIDSATTEQARALLAAFSRTGGYESEQKCTVTLDGPEKWCITTPAIPEERANALVREWVS
jgi:hypothetical protein